MTPASLFRNLYRATEFGDVFARRAIEFMVERLPKVEPWEKMRLHHVMVLSVMMAACDRSRFYGTR
jgi:hypothetical protein